MHKSKLAVGLAAAIALVAGPTVATTANASSASSNTGSHSAYYTPAGAVGASSVTAGVKQYPKPVKKYTKKTALAVVPADGTTVASTTFGKAKGCKVKSVTFTPSTIAFQVGVDWSSWGSPPFTESATPAIFYTNGSTSLTLKYDSNVKTAGAEIEPNPFEVHDYTVTTSAGETIKVTADGSGGARLGAAKFTKPFNSLTITDVSTAVAPADFAIAQVRAC